MKSFVVSNKTECQFEFFVDGERHVESIFINMEDQSLSEKLASMEDEVKQKISEIKIDDVEIKSGLDLNKLKTFDDYASLNEEQVEELTAVASATKKATDAAGEVYIEELCKAFDTDVRPAFKYCKPFDVVNGNYYIFAFLEAIGDEILEHHQKEAKKVEKTLQGKGYMQKYMNRSSRRSQGGKKK